MSAAMTTVLLGHAIGAELRNITAAISQLQGALNRTGAELHEAKSVAADAHEEMSILSLERQSVKIIEKIEKGEYSIDYVTGRLRDKKGHDVELPPQLLDTLTAGSSSNVKEAKSSPVAPLRLAAQAPAVPTSIAGNSIATQTTPPIIVVDSTAESPLPQAPSEPPKPPVQTISEDPPSRNEFSDPAAQSDTNSISATLPVLESSAPSITSADESATAPDISSQDSSSQVVNSGAQVKTPTVKVHDDSTLGTEVVDVVRRDESANHPVPEEDDNLLMKSEGDNLDNDLGEGDDVPDLDDGGGGDDHKATNAASHFSVKPLLHATTKHLSHADPTGMLSGATAKGKSKPEEERQEVVEARERADRHEALVKRLRLAHEAADPASLKSDFVMLQDIAIVLVAASFGGMLVAFFFGAANTAFGYVIGGYLVGPSSPLLVYGLIHVDSPYRSTLRRVDAVHTVAMLGPIFELFKLGIYFATLRRQRKNEQGQRGGQRQAHILRNHVIPSSSEKDSVRDDSDEEQPSAPASPANRKQPPPEKNLSSPLGRRHSRNLSSSGLAVLSDISNETSKNNGKVSSLCMGNGGNVAGSRRLLWYHGLAFFSPVFTCAAFLSTAVKWTQTVPEAFLFAAAVTLSGTSQVLAALDSGQVRHLPLGTAIVDLLTMQDLILAPCLAIPTALHNSIFPSGGSSEAWTKTFMVYTACVLAAIFLSRVAVPFVLYRIRVSSMIAALGTSEISLRTSDSAKNRELLNQPTSKVREEKTQSENLTDNSAAPLPPFPLIKGSSEPAEDNDLKILPQNIPHSAIDAGRTLPPNSSSETRVAPAAPSELLTIVVVGYALGMSLISEQMSLSYGFGALVAGLFWQSNIISSYENGRAASVDLCALDTDALRLQQRLRKEQLQATEAVAATLASLFGSVYLASLGMIVSPVFLWNNAGTIAFFVAVTFGLKTCGAALILRLSIGIPWAEALAAGSTLGHVSTVALFFIGRAQTLGLFSRQLHLLTMSSAFVHMALRPAPIFLLRKALQSSHTPAPPPRRFGSVLADWWKCLPYSAVSSAANCRNCRVSLASPVVLCSLCACARHKQMDETL